MPNGVTVRSAAAAEVALARELVERAGLPLDGFEEIAVLLVAVQDGRIVGVAGLEDHADTAGRTLLLRSVAVSPEARGLGVGSALTRAAMQRAADEHAPVALLTETAADWFPRFAFQEVDRADLPTALAASRELQGACALSARAFIAR